MRRDLRGSTAAGRWRVRRNAPAAAVATCLVLLLYGYGASVLGPHPSGSDVRGPGSTVLGSNPLSLDLAASPSKGTAPLTVSFWANASGGVPPYRFSWDFGDGNTSVQGDVSHSYARPGNYTATATVEDSTLTALTRTLTIGAAPPALAVFLTLLSPIPNSAHVATLEANVTGGEPPFLYTWEFGDGSGLVSPSAVINHTYMLGGSYSATVEVTDGEGIVALGVATVMIPGSGGPDGPCLWSTASCGPFGVSYVAAGLVFAVVLAVTLAAVWGLYRWSRRSSPDGVVPRRIGPQEGGPVPAISSQQPPAAPVTAQAPIPFPTAPPPASSNPAPTVSSLTPGNGRPMSEQILIHLYRQGVPDPNRAVPGSFTQDGLALALNRPQSAFARALLRLEEAGLVRVEIAHVQGRGRRAKTYRLTPKGESAARRLGASNPPRPTAEPRDR
jgi:PKD repeat protein